MISYKKIDLLKLTVLDDCLLFNTEMLIIKSPIMKYEFSEDMFILKINPDSDRHNTFLNLCSYIERLFRTFNLKSKIINNNDINLYIDDNSEFYDSNKEEINKKLVKNTGKIICSFKCKSGKFFLKEMLQIKI
jgi:hypothetical protein